MVNSMLKEWGKVKLPVDGGRCKELNFSSTITGSQWIFFLSSRILKIEV